MFEANFLGTKNIWGA